MKKISTTKYLDNLKDIHSEKIIIKKEIKKITNLDIDIKYIEIKENIVEINTFSLYRFELNFFKKDIEKILRSFNLKLKI